MAELAATFCVWPPLVAAPAALRRTTRTVRCRPFKNTGLMTDTVGYIGNRWEDAWAAAPTPYLGAAGGDSKARLGESLETCRRLQLSGRRLRS